MLVSGGFKGASGDWQWFDEPADTFRWYKDGTPSSPSATDMTPSRAIDPALVAPPAAPKRESIVRADEIAQLVTLHERGALTDEEFAAAKARLLGL